MKSEKNTVDFEDYAEPACPFCTDMWQKEKPVHRIDVKRVIDKLDEFLSSNDTASAEKLLLYWLSEAENGNDRQGMLAMHGELTGFYRKEDNREKSLSNAEKVLSLIDEINLSDTVTGATEYINAATAFKAFGEPEKAMEYYEKAEKILTSEKNPPYVKIGGLYNNEALAMNDLKRYGEAKEYFFKAIEAMKNVENSEPEQAISYLNLADCVFLEIGAEDGAEEISDYVDKAQALLEKAEKRDGNYAYVCSKCYPVFEYYGYFAYAKELKERSEKIYEGN